MPDYRPLLHFLHEKLDCKVVIKPGKTFRIVCLTDAIVGRELDELMKLIKEAEPDHYFIIPDRDEMGRPKLRLYFEWKVEE